jgi:hypothetical protein
MRARQGTSLRWLWTATAAIAVIACGGDEGDDAGSTVAGAGAEGQVSAVGGQPSGGAPSGGAPSGGAPSGGAPSGGAPAAGSGGESTGGVSTTGGSTGLTCENVQAEAAVFVASNKTCTSGQDCVQVSAGCYADQEDCCVVYLSRDYDQAAWALLLEQLDSCLGPCACCAAIPAPPGCTAGRCGPDRG